MSPSEFLSNDASETLAGADNSGLANSPSTVRPARLHKISPPRKIPYVKHRVQDLAPILFLLVSLEEDLAAKQRRIIVSKLTLAWACSSYFRKPQPPPTVSQVDSASIRILWRACAKLAEQNLE
jgi:hypothetical protein